MSRRFSLFRNAEAYEDSARWFGGFLARTDASPRYAAEFRRSSSVFDALMVRPFHELCDGLKEAEVHYNESALAVACVAALRVRSHRPGVSFCSQLKESVSESRLKALLNEEEPDGVLRIMHNLLAITGSCDRYDVASIAYGLLSGNGTRRSTIQNVTANFYRSNRK